MSSNPNYTYIDTNMLIYLGKEQQFTGNNALDALYTNNRKIIITTTVRDEAIRDSRFTEIPVIKSWINAGVASGKLQIVNTPQFNGLDSALKGQGELSIQYSIKLLHPTTPVFIVTNDNKFIGSIGSEPLQRAITP